MPLDRAELLKVRTIVAHADCADGILAALIAHEAIPEARVRFVHYDTPEHRELPAESGMLFVDITPPRSRVSEFVKAGGIVLDHHAKAKDIVEAFGVRGVYSDEPGVSGAMLAHSEVWRPLLGAQNPASAGVIWSMATQVGVRDTWQRSDVHFEAGSAIAAALKFWPWRTWLEAESDDADADSRYSRWAARVRLLDVGGVVLANARVRAAELVAEAHRFQIDALRVVAFQGESPDASEAADQVGDAADLVLAWHYRCDDSRTRLTIHCRSRGRFDAGDFALFHGGGGHVGSSGFTVGVDQRDGSPFQHVERLVRHYLWAQSVDPHPGRTRVERQATARKADR